MFQHTIKKTAANLASHIVTLNFYNLKLFEYPLNFVLKSLCLCKEEANGRFFLNICNVVSCTCNHGLFPSFEDILQTFT